MSLHDFTQPSEKRATCAKHDETLKLFCQTCDQPICGDCTVIDHHGHRYLFMKDVFVSEKEMVLKFAQESKTAVSALESAVAKIEARELKLQKCPLKVRQCIDSFVNAQIESLKSEGERLKNELQRSISTQEEHYRARKDSLFLSLGCLKSTVEFTEQALSRGDEAAVLSAKDQLFQQLTQSAATLFSSEAKQRESILCTLKINESLDNETVRKIAQISMHDDNYKLSMYGGNFGHLDETYVDKVCLFVISKEKLKADHDFDHRRILEERYSLLQQSISSFQIVRPMSSNFAQVRIKAPGSMDVSTIIIKAEKESFYFSYLPDKIGTYSIEIIINGQYVQGSPFDWIVKGFVTSRQYRKMDDEFDQFVVVLNINNC